MSALRARLLGGDDSKSSSISVLTADVKDPKSLQLLAARARVVINCVGPFRLYGEPVVRACVENGTHYVDITGEPEFIESMMVRYHESAVRGAVCVVPACGFDSIPADLGLDFAIKQFQHAYPDGLATQAESFLTIKAPRGGAGHYGTYESLVHGLSSVNNLRRIRADLRNRQTQNGAWQLRKAGPRLQLQSRPYWEPRVQRWCIPFPGSDASVVSNTQYLTLEAQQGRSATPTAQFAEYVTFPSVWFLVLLTIISTLISLLLKFKDAGKKLLLKYPRVCTFGMFSHEGSTREQLAVMTTTLTTFVKGYRNKPADGVAAPLDAELVSEVTGGDPGYGLCAVVVSEAAYAILRSLERQGAAPAVGVVTPAFAFRDTDIIEHCNRTNLIKFAVKP